MITVHRLNGSEYTLNAELIKCVETSPDTIITLLSGEKLVVQEKVHEVCDKVLKYKWMIQNGFHSTEPSGGEPQ